MSKFKQSFYSGMNQADQAAPQVNLVVSGMMMLCGSAAFLYVALHGPSMIFFRIALLLGCATIAFAGFSSFKMWSKKIREDRKEKKDGQKDFEVHP